MPGIAALIVAAGQGRRAGGAVPKQFQPLLGQPVLRRSAAAFARIREIAILQIVAPANNTIDAEAASASSIRPSASTSWFDPPKDVWV